jgi:TPR repeat protein
MYAAGEGVPQDDSQAKEWCKKSALPFSYIVLGRMAEKGLGQQKSSHDALEFYRNAAALGLPDGYLDTGRLEMESGSHEGEKNAYFWYLIASKYKVPGADIRLTEAAARLNEKEKAEQQKQVAEWLKVSLYERLKNLKNH